MKKLTMIGMAALLMLAVSCKKDNEQKINNAGNGFRATVETQAGDSKTHLEGLAVTWSANENILVSSNTCSAGKTFTFAGYASEGVANFEASELPENFYEPSYTAYYPASKTISLSDKQTYVENSFAEGANPMMAVSENTVLDFKNLCGMLELQFYCKSTFNVKSITITSLVEEKLNGEGTAEWNNGEPVLNLSSGTKSLTLECNNEPMSTDEANPTFYYFVLPANTLASGFTVAVTDENDKVWEKTTTKDKSIVRSRVTTLDAIEVNIPTPYYSVSNDTKVLFAHGNLQYIGSAATPYWQFADNQYDVLSTVGQTGGADDIDRDFFGWGANGLEYTDHNAYFLPWNYETIDVDGLYDEDEGYGYGPTTNSYQTDLSVSAGSDWGALSITNGEGKDWRTLSCTEWDYLFKRESSKGKLRGIGYVGERKGLFILPDNWDEMIAFVGIADNFKYGSDGNSYTETEWEIMQEAGATFLPAAGYRWKKKGVNELIIDDKNECCAYWTSTHSGTGDAFAVDSDYFYDNVMADHKRSKGFCVRLAYDLN